MASELAEMFDEAHDALQDSAGAFDLAAMFEEGDKALEDDQAGEGDGRPEDCQEDEAFPEDAEADEENAKGDGMDADDGQDVDDEQGARSANGEQHSHLKYARRVKAGIKRALEAREADDEVGHFVEAANSTWEGQPSYPPL